MVGPWHWNGNPEELVKRPKSKYKQIHTPYINTGATANHHSLCRLCKSDHPSRKKVRRLNQEGRSICCVDLNSDDSATWSCRGDQPLSECRTTRWPGYKPQGYKPQGSLGKRRWGSHVQPQLNVTWWWIWCIHRVDVAFPFPSRNYHAAPKHSVPHINFNKSHHMH